MMFRFKKNCRLHNFKLIRSLKEDGELLYASETFKSKCLIVERKPKLLKLSDVQILITVPKKKIKKAVDRNLIKRRIREVFRLNKTLIKHSPNNLICFEIIYISQDLLNFNDIKKEIINIFFAINKYVEQKNITDAIEFQNVNK